MSYSIFRVEKVKNANATRAIQRHNQRENKTYGNQDIDHARTHLNYDLINQEKIRYTEKIDQVIEDGYKGTRKIRLDAIRHVDGIITSDREFFDKLSPDLQKRFFQDSLEFIKKEYGEKNVLYATVHMDEKTPHMHFGFVPMTEDGRLSAKDVLGNKKALSELQDRFNEHLNKMSYNLKRGERMSGVEHLDMQKFKEKMLKETVATLETEVQSLQQDFEKISKVKTEIERLHDIGNKVKEGRFTNKVIMDKKDFEAFKSVAQSGIATLEKFEHLKKTSSETVQKLTIENKNLQRERNYYMDRNQELLKENRGLKQENSLLKKELARFQEFVKNTISNVKQGMKKLAQQLKSDSLYNVFAKQVLNPSVEEAKEKYVADLNHERKKENELER